MQETIINWAANDVNVCAVDWGPLSQNINYFLVAQINTVRVANFLTEFLVRLERLGIVLAQTTLAGHSLGAQIAGKIGSKLQKDGRTMGRIFGQCCHFV